MTHFTHLPALALAALIAPSALIADPATYASPQAALDAFVAGLETPGPDALLEVFGPEAADMVADNTQEENDFNRATIIALYSQGYRFQPTGEDSVHLLLGAESWPFPVPIARTGDAWQFDIAAGRDEILFREIGLNELDVIDLMFAYVSVQSTFRALDQDDDGVMEFAQSIISDAESRTGLFWPGDDSPFGELLALAAFEGYSDGSEDHQPQPYLGYYFKVLHGQSAAAPGGEISYLVNDNMIAGHALLAVPANYGETGVHAFMVSENGIVLEADLGEDSLSVAADMATYDPTDAWAPVQ